MVAHRFYRVEILSDTRAPTTVHIPCHPPELIQGAGWLDPSPAVVKVTNHV